MKKRFGLWKRKRIFGGLKAYLRATDHTSSNIISRDFWFARLQVDKAAIKSMLVNRVGDFGLALGIFGCFTLFQTIDFSTIFACASALPEMNGFCNMSLNAITQICAHV
jgi:NADH:ubiquinone oxidoreductase subunit 5 (subunit L)/multisubunit Na+/H+ antiporter MnhA subunit